MSSDSKVLVAGSAISSPAGSSDLDYERYRVIRGGSDRLAAALSVFPQLRKLMTGSAPLILGCYPAALGSFPSAVVIDTYLRPANFIRGLALAAARDMTAIVISQPLIIADMLAQAALAKVRLPQRLLIASGGYPMPASLERFIRTLLFEHGCAEAEVLHSYGVAEVDFGILAALRSADGSLVYRRLADDIEIRIHQGLIELRRQTEYSWVTTPDRGQETAAGLIIFSDAGRVHPRVLAELESWDAQRWQRCTGRLSHEGALAFRQLRKHVQPLEDCELSFHAFFERFGGSSLDKPDWSLKAD